MKRAHRRFFNLFAFALLAISVYLNFFYKEKSPKPVPSTTSKAAVQNPSTSIPSN